MDKPTKAFSDYAELQHVSQGRENREITSMCSDSNHFLFADSKGQTSFLYLSPRFPTSPVIEVPNWKQIPDLWQPRITSVWAITTIISMLSNGPLSHLQRMSSVYNVLQIFKAPTPLPVISNSKHFLLLHLILPQASPELWKTGNSSSAMQPSLASSQPASFGTETARSDEFILTLSSAPVANHLACGAV